MPVESTEDRCCKPDLKKDAQRTNRFNTSPSNDSAPSNLTLCNHLESNSRISVDYKMQEKDDVPCINIILKPILDPKTEQKDKGIQIVEITAVTENVNKHSSGNTSPAPFDTDRADPVSRSSKMEKVETKCVTIQTEDEKTFRDISMQTAETSNNQKSIGICKINQSTPEYKSVQFIDNKTITDEGKMNGVSDLKTCIENNGREDDVKLSERIKRKIDKLANKSREMRSQIDFLPCNDMCKQIATQPELLNSYLGKTRTSFGENDRSNENTDTLPSVFSNNSPIPRISIDTTETTEWKLPSKNKSSEVTIDATFSDSRISSAPGNIPCCPDQNSSIDDIPSRSRNLTSEQNSSENISCNTLQQSPENNEATVCINKEGKSTLTVKNIEKFNRDFLSSEVETLSELGVARNSSAKTKSTNTSNGVTSLGTNSINVPQTHEYESAVDTQFRDRSDFVLSNPITRNTLTASDLTRPEFVRMLTEIKEHTCSLEIQLSAMNEAMKRKQTTRSKAFSSSLKNYDTPRQDQDIAHRTQPEKSNTIHEPTCCTGEVSSIEDASYATEELHVNHSMDSLYYIPSNDTSLLENRHLKNESKDDNKNCCEEIIATPRWESYAPPKSHKKLKPSSRIDRSNKPEDIILLQENSNISLRKHKLKKPVFKTKRSYLWTPLRYSDYRMWKRILHKATPSAEAMATSRINSQSVSPELSMVGPKVDMSCSPTSCCDASGISPPAPVLQTMFKAASVRSDICSTISNSFINQTNVKSPFLTSTPKKLGTQYNTSNESESKSDHKFPEALNTVPQTPDLDSSKYSNVRRKYPQDRKMEPAAVASNLNPKCVVQKSPLKSKRSKLRSRLGVERSSFEDKTKDYPTVIPSNCCLSPLENKQSTRESSHKVFLKNSRTEQDSSKRSFAQSNKLGRIPRLKRKPIHHKNPSDTRIQTGNSQACVDATSCSPINCSEIISTVNISPHSNTTESVPAEKIWARDVAHTITSEQNTPVSVNNNVSKHKYDSEEEVHSTDYAVNKSVEDYCCELEFKNNGLSKKRKRKCSSRESTGFDGKSGFNNSIDSKAAGISEHNSQSFEYEEHSHYKMNDTKKAKSLGNQEHDDISEKCCNSNSQEKDSKCTIRVTVSLDKTPSNEAVKKISELHIDPTY